MKILRIIYDWPKPWHGLAPHPYEVTRSQVELGHEVEMFVGFWPKSGGAEEIEGVKLHKLWREPVPGTVNLTVSVLLLFKYIRWRKKNSVDIIHSHGHLGIWIYAYRLFLSKFFPWAKELRVPLVVHFHRVAKSRWDKMISDKKPIRWYSKFLQWPLEVLSDVLALKVAEACIFVSEENKADAIKYHQVDEKKCFVVSSGVNPKMFVSNNAEEREKSRKELGLDIYDKVILYVGLVSERKNVLATVNAMQFLPFHYKFMMVGPEDAVYSQRIEEAITKHQLEEQILRVGYTPYPQLPIAFQIADVFCFPSSWEGSPKVVLEALATGLPCLVSGFKYAESIPGLVYLESDDPKYLAQKVQEIIERPPAVDRESVISKYSWGKKVLEIDQVYAFAKRNLL